VLFLYNDVQFYAIMHDTKMKMIIIDNNKILSTISCLSQRPVYINNLLPVKIDNIVIFLIFSLRREGMYA